MSDGNASDPTAAAPLRVSLVLFVTTTTLAVTTWGTLAYTTVATIIAAEFGVSPAAIGYQVGLAYLSAMLCALYSGNLAVAIGAPRTLFLAMVLTGMGSLVSTSFSVFGLLLGTVLLGFAHGLVNPAAAILLARTSHAGRRSLLFSIRQTGTPLGGLAVALVSPWLAEVFGWRAAGYALAACAVAVGVSAWLASRHWQAPGPRELLRFSANPLESLSIVARSSSLRILALAAMCYAGVQVSLVAFLSPFLVEDLSLSLILAGGLVAMAQVSGGFGRPLWGFVADFFADNLVILAIAGIVAAFSAFAMAALSPGTSLWSLYLLVFVFGATAIGWNGVFAAELVRLAPHAQTSHAMAGASFLTFASAVVLPAAFALLYEIIDSYSVTIAAMGSVSLIGSVVTFWLRHRQSQ